MQKNKLNKNEERQQQQKRENKSKIIFLNAHKTEEM